jgi:hypothetical protein
LHVRGDVTTNPVPHGLPSVHGLHPQPGQLVTAVGENPQRLELTVARGDA